MLKSVSADEAKRLVEGGAMFVDIREADEHAREYIPGSRNHALSKLDGPIGTTRPIVFHCRSGARTTANAVKLANVAAPVDAYLLSGGLDAWKKAGHAVARGHRKPIEMMRQVQITVGTLVLLSALAAWFVDPRLILLAGLFGAGLLFAGVSGTCMLAKLLRLMPWNRPDAVA